MPTYYFQLVDGGDLYHDSEGQEFPDDEAARHEATLVLTEVARDVLVKDGLCHDFEVTVIDEAGRTVWQTKLNYEAVPGRQAPSSTSV